MPRFFLAASLSDGQTLTLPDAITKHIHILRLRRDSEIILFNGDGQNYHARLIKIEKRSTQAHIHAVCLGQTESPLHTVLIQSVSCGERMDFTLQKSVELGVNAIFPVISERSVVRLTGERAEKRQIRWQEIVISACEQSGRNHIPPVHPIQSYRQALSQLPATDLKLLMSPTHTQPITSLPKPHSVIFMIGPEGGFSPDEEKAAFAAGFQAITLGKRILRTETAALATLACMQSLWGDFT